MIRGPARRTPRQHRPIFSPILTRVQAPETSEIQHTAGGEDRSISMARANVLALATMPVTAALVMVPYVLLHGVRALEGGWNGVVGPLVFIPLVLISIVVHEGLHGLGFLVSGVPRSSLRFGVQRQTLTPYASCTVPVEARHYRLAAAMPALVLGIVPAIIGWATGWVPAAVYAMWMLWFAGGDLLILWIIRDLPARTLVIDHPDRAGCRIVAG